MPTLLLVDDSRTMREVFKVYLMGKDFELLEASTVRRAQHLLELMPVDIVVVDVNLPEVDGLTFVRSLRAHENAKLRDLPVIVITSDKARDARDKASEAGADAFLHKPLDSERVLSTIESLLESRAQ